MYDEFYISYSFVPNQTLVILNSISTSLIYLCLTFYKQGGLYIYTMDALSNIFCVTVFITITIVPMNSRVMSFPLKFKVYRKVLYFPCLSHDIRKSLKISSKIIERYYFAEIKFLT